MLFGLGLPEWLTIIGLLGGLILTFYIMARASVAYEAKRKAREAGSAGSQERNEAGSAGSQERNEAASEERVEQREQENQKAEEESGT
ncbi:MAG: hypothetical protein GEU68_08350 [Actinobacteria bacterium]|nr:hypothetical protein [Actinomycetota bacterium]